MSAKSVAHGVGESVVHTGEHVGVGVQRLRYGGVAQEFLDILGVDVAVEQQRGAGVTEVVEPDRLGQRGRLLDPGSLYAC